MKKKLYIGLAAVYIFFMTAIGYNASLALFVDSATSTNNTFSAASEFATPSATITTTGTEVPTGTQTPTPSTSEIPAVATTGAIVINEISSASTNEWVELYNPTGVPINVSGWVIQDNNSVDTLPVSPVIPPGGFAVIVESGSLLSVPGSAITITLDNPTIGNGLRNDGDRITIQNAANSQVDSMSYGDDTTIFTLTAPSATQSQSRDSNGTDTNLAGDWHIDATPSIGVVN